MDSLIKTLPAIMKAAGDAPEVAAAACFAAWKQVAGEALRANAVPLSLNERTLVIAVADAAWQKQMQSLSGQLLFRLNSLLGQPVITYLEFCENPQAIAQARSELTVAPETKVSLPVPVELVEAAAEIHDTDLRRAFLGAASSCIKRIEN